MTFRILHPITLIAAAVASFTSMITCTKPPAAPDRDILSLDGVWEFILDPDDAGTREAWFASAERWKHADTISVPGSWDAHKLERYDGFGWYARDFAVDAKSGMNYAVVFESVDDNADVWLNGTRIGSHAGCGRRFSFDVTALLQAGSNRLVVRVEDVGGPGGLVGPVKLQSYESEDELLQSPFYHDKPVDSPDWVRDAVIYECFVRNFSAEGSFSAVERRLPELKALGVTVLWLMPIHPVGVVHRKGSLGSPYSVKDFYAVNPEFGTLEDFRSLVDAAHREGLRIIIDLVANHTAWDNPLMTEHPDWYTRDASGAAMPPVQDWSDVADLDYSKPALRSWMTKMLLYWVRDVGIDGFRCDVAEMVPHDYWVEACAALRAVKPVMMLAEGATPDLHVGAFDLTYAWNTYDGLPRFIDGSAPASELADDLRRERFLYPAGSLRLRFTTNHDKNCYDAPPVERYGVDGARAMAVLLHTLPGVPMIYNGQEVGTDKHLCLFEKDEIDWSADRHGFRQLYTELNALRRKHAAMRDGTLTVRDTKQYRSLFIATRESRDETILVAVNLTASGAEVTLDEPALAGFERLLGNCAYSTDRDRLGMKVPGFGYFVGVKRK